MNLSLHIEVVPQLSFAEMLEKLWVEKYTGSVTVHFAQGKPNTVEIPAEPTRIRLEKR